MGESTDRCRYTHPSESRPDESGGVCCWRPVWNDTGRCIWHANTASKPIEELREERLDIPERLDGAHLRNVDIGSRISFVDCSLVGAKFSHFSPQGSDLSSGDFRRADLRGADFERVDLTNADLREAMLSDASLVEATLYNANLSSAVMCDVDLQDADLTHANLFDADLRGADIYGALLADTRVNRGTEFRTPSAGTQSETVDAEQLERRLWTYQSIEQLARANSLPELARQSYLHRKDTRRRWYVVQGRNHWRNAEFGRATADWVRWLRSSGANLLMRYGESPLRVVGASLLVIVACALVYPFLGLASMAGAESSLTSPPSSPRTFLLEVFTTSLYFSVVTFSTLGYGDLRPEGWLAQALASAEALVGALLIALIVFVLGRRATW